MKRTTLYPTRKPPRHPVSGFARRRSLGLRTSRCRLPVLLSLGLLIVGGLTGIAQTKNMNDSTNHLETATLGGGCFWCTEALFQMLPGVKSITSGYAGGAKENPTYKEVCTGNTGHAEVIQIKYDPKVISYEKLLETFWEAHDPTTLNRPGPRPRHAIPFHHSLFQRSPEGRGGKVKGGGAEAFPPAHRHGNCAAEEVLPGRGLSPGLLPRESQPTLLPGRDPPKGREVREETERSKAVAVAARRRTTDTHRWSRRGTAATEPERQTGILKTGTRIFNLGTGKVRGIDTAEAYLLAGDWETAPSWRSNRALPAS